MANWLQLMLCREKHTITRLKRLFGAFKTYFYSPNVNPHILMSAQSVLPFLAIPGRRNPSSQFPQGFSPYLVWVCLCLFNGVRLLVLQIHYLTLLAVISLKHKQIREHLWNHGLESFVKKNKGLTSKHFDQHTRGHQLKSNRCITAIILLTLWVFALWCVESYSPWLTRRRGPWIKF